ncbi:myelin-oligodendrocyte glycoprotein-like [Excalfactoria chinensis]|uniref:myelin-oligodendrocyte glycoprotein-like n=1 Tax=Excalfactoria chinensis TaxID=46218 RepID=UPI003B3AB829
MDFTSRSRHSSFSHPWRTLLAHLMSMHLLHLGSAQLTVVAPKLHVTAIIGQDVVLRCHLSPSKDAWSSEIRWFLNGSTGLVHHYQNGFNLEQMEEYKGRTELLRNGLSNGNLDLLITAVSFADSGSYICAVQDGDDYAEAVVELEVSDHFSQNIHPWKVALAVVVTLLVGSLVIIAFLHRKQVALRRELKRSDAKLGTQARKLDSRAVMLKKHVAELGIQVVKLEKDCKEIEEPSRRALGDGLCLAVTTGDELHGPQIAQDNKPTLSPSQQGNPQQDQEEPVSLLSENPAVLEPNLPQEALS